MRPKFSNSSISMRPEKPINRFSTILNLVLIFSHWIILCKLFQSKNLSFSIKLHVRSASHSNINYILHLLQIVSFEEYHLLMEVFNFTSLLRLFHSNYESRYLFKNWLSLIKHFTFVEFEIAKSPAALSWNLFFGRYLGFNLLFRSKEVRIW